MSQIEVAPLSERLSEEEIAELASALEEIGAPSLPRAADDLPVPVGARIDEEVMTEFFDRLEAHDLACDIYLPVEFEGRIDVADLRVGSAVSLLEVLEELKEELAVDEDDELEEGDEPDDELIMDTKLRHVWKLVFDGAQSAIERHLPLHLAS